MKKTTKKRKTFCHNYNFPYHPKCLPILETEHMFWHVFIVISTRLPWNLNMENNCLCSEILPLPLQVSILHIFKTSPCFSCTGINPILLTYLPLFLPLSMQQCKAIIRDSPCQSCTHIQDCFSLCPCSNARPLSGTFFSAQLVGKLCLVPLAKYDSECFLSI